MGIDIKAAAVQLARGSVQGLMRADAEYARQAAPMRFHTHNVFMPSLRHKVSCELPVCCLSGQSCQHCQHTQCLIFFLTLLSYPDGPW